MDDKKLVLEYIEKIKKINIGRDVTIMEICGGHTNVIMKYGVRSLLPSNVRLISGPGCPVCVSSQHDIDCMIELAYNGVPVATYGDMMRVPGSRVSLDDAKAKTGKVFEVYSTTEVLKLKEKYPDIVFFGVGFETTAPMTAFLLDNGVCVYSVHKLVPPAMEALLAGEVKVDGFINPGHVSTIIGVNAYKGIDAPQVISGFSIERIMRGITLLIGMIKEGKSGVMNGYTEAVTDEGNKLAQDLLNKTFKVVDSEWRGLGVLPMSGLEVRDDNLNAKIKYKEIFDKIDKPKNTGCRCGEILKGLIEPVECGLYGKRCTPEDPQGACMVSAEGSCSISYRCGK